MGRLSSNKFAWEIANQLEIKHTLDRLGAVTNDFRIPFLLISSDFYRSQRKLFTLQSPGLYEDLSPKYKPVKQKKSGFIYPILVGKTRKLSNSTLGHNNEYSVFRLDRNTLTIGSSVPYGKYHQSDEARTKIPQRKFIFIDGGSGDTSKDSFNGRRERWINIVQTHINQIVLGRI